MAQNVDINIKVYPDGRVDTSNAATYLGLSPKTLAMFRSNGKGPQFIKRGRVFYYLKDLDEWLNADGIIDCSDPSVNSDLEIRT